VTSIGLRWNAYNQALKRSLDGEFDGADERHKASAIEDVIRCSSSAAALIILQPFPVIDAALIAPVQHRMVEAIGRIHGYQVDRTTRDRIFKAFRGKLITLNAAIAGAKLVPFVPFVGDLFAMSVAYALTSTIGELSDRYFRSRFTMTPSCMTACFNAIYKEQYERTYKKRRNELKALWRTPGIRRQVAELKKERREGRLTDDETERRIEELLRHP
jgi:uncharacterized protein (DUF697 family)